jgi:hypothetical protein
MAGIRVWMGAIMAFGSTVMIAHENRGEPSGDSHVSQRPANANSPPSFIRM